MRIINRTAIDETFVRDIAQRAAVLDRDLVLFLDNTTNAVRADHARAKLEEYRQKGWKPLYGWDRDATADNDSHACTVNKRTIGTQKLPAYVIEAINGYDLLVYIDAMYTKEQGPDLVIALAHEFRHVWQYFNAPVVFHSQTALSWVHPPQETPCELDAERGAKRVLEDLYGPATAREYVNREVAHCPPEHREVLQRLAVLDTADDPEMEKKTLRLLEQHAAAIRKFQADGAARFPGYIMPGLLELTEALRGKSAIRFLH
jgi:hypothetical protein